jgi:parallel beta-helix repeat protein
MKTLEQVEPRTPVNATNTPGGSFFEFIISQPGSYYLTGDVTTAKETAIRIAASSVTLDLNGFEIRFGGSGGAESGVEILGARCTVKNGRISGFFYGVRNEPGAFDVPGSAAGPTLLHLTLAGNQHGLLIFASGARIEGCTAVNNSSGITTGAAALVRNCLASGNAAGGTGISVGAGSNVTHCTASNNGGRGIAGQSDVTIESCTAVGNGRDGIAVGDRCVVRSSTANRNGGTSGVLGTGISAGIRALISGCSADENRDDGIAAQGDSVIVNNRASFNGRGGAGAAAAGIHVTGAGSRIEGNHTRDTNGIGIRATLADVVIRNTAGNNSEGNFVPATGNNFGPVQNAATATSPTANHVF